MGARQLLTILVARRWIVVLTMLVCALIAALAVFVLPQKYMAVGQVLIDVRGPATVAIAGDSNAAPQLQPDYLATQVDLIKSDRVAVAAVKKLGLTRDPAGMQKYHDSGSELSPELYFANLLDNDLRVAPSDQSRVISLSYQSRDPQAAATIANAFINAYSEVSVDLQRQPALNAAANYQHNVDELAAKLKAAIDELSAKRKQLGLTASTADGTDAEDARLVALSQQLASAQAVQAAQHQRGAGGALPDAMNNPVIQNLQSEIARVESQRSQIATYAGPNNADFKQLSAQLAQLKGELERQRGQVAAAAATAAGQASAASAQLGGALNAQRARVIATEHARGEVATLAANVANLQNTYQSLTAKQAQNNILGMTDQSNVVVINYANPPTQPAGLPAPLKLVASLMVGAVLGMLLAVLIELFDQRMRRSEDATAWLGIPDLGQIRNSRALPSPAMRRLAGPMRFLPRLGEGPSE